MRSVEDKRMVSLTIQVGVTEHRLLARWARAYGLSIERSIRIVSIQAASDWQERDAAGLRVPGEHLRLVPIEAEGVE